MAYAWSQKGISYFVSTCGSTARSDKTYRSHFENEFGDVDFKDLPRPKLADFLYEFLPLIDEHNRMRQDRLALEKCWPTKNCWFRLIITLLGMCVVDLQRVYRNKDPQYTDWDILKFADYIAGDLKPVEVRQSSAIILNHKRCLKRIRGKDGNMCSPLTKSQRDKGMEMGNNVVSNCFMCKKYEPDGKYKKTTW